MSKITNGVKVEARIGGDNGLRRLLDYCKKNNIPLYLTAEIIEIHESGNGFSPSRDGNRYLNNGLAFLYKWDPVIKKKNRDYDPWFIVLPSKVPSYLNNFLKGISKYGINNALIEKMGEYVYSQNKFPRLLSREEVISLWREALSSNIDKYNFIFTSGNLYILPYTSMLLDVSLDCSNFSIESEAIPFYPMIIHGYIPFSGRPGNLRESQKKEFLRMVEYGAIPYYMFIYKDSSYFKKSFYNEMLSSNYKDWIEQAVEEYNKVKNLYLNIYDVPIKSHNKLTDGVYRVEYENGAEIVVNYNKASYLYKGKMVRGEDFLFSLGKK